MRNTLKAVIHLLPALIISVAADHHFRHIKRHSLHRRDGCSTVTVSSGDSCTSLATKCGISGSDFTQYNPSSTLCSSLVPGQKVCCSAGGLSIPTKNADGSCSTYPVQSGDSCSAISASNGITASDLEIYNQDKTWGWSGCDSLKPDINICLSPGSPPVPPPLSDAVCGPQVQGTPPPESDTSLADLNQCPLSACCNTWGQCGITAEYCTPSGSGSPGTTAPGTNGCISNCGTDIVTSDSPPETFRRIAYLEAFNMDRPCLNMDISQLDISKYTHVHFAFGSVTSDFEIDINAHRIQFGKFSKLHGVKRIVSLGGWAFSTEPSTYDIFRQAVTSENRATFAQNVADFIKEWDLDGVDFDWEYPSEPDIPGIPAGDDNEGKNYALFLKILRGLLPDKSISAAAPASYWYLKGYPVVEIDAAVDYWVFMAYDLHGQWDYGNDNAITGCPGGNCLRSHVNLTETESALSMITKAGASSNKLVVGLSNYGRSFQMTTPGCTGPMCTYTGPGSGATPGRCTETAGLLADAEIYEIIASDSTTKAYKDQDSDSNILVYGGDQWVAYMDADVRSSRANLYQSLNMGGVVEWAVDLEKFREPPTQTGSPSASNTPSGSYLNPTAVPRTNSINPYLYACTKKQKSMVLEAWQEASTLAGDHYEWTPNGKWQEAMDMYIGKNTRGSFSWITGPGPVMKNIERQWNIHHSWGSPVGSYAYIYCDETKIPGSEKPSFTKNCFGNKAAYTWDEPGIFWTAHYVVLCPMFFTARMTTLSDREDYANEDPFVQRTIDYWRPLRSTVLFHETYHWEYTVSDPKCKDYAYPPSRIVGLAENAQGKARANAESYAMAAMAIHLQKAFHLDSPPTPLPQKPRGGSQEALVAGADVQDTSLDSKPDWWEAPVSIDSETFEPDMTNTDRMSRIGYMADSVIDGDCTPGLWGDMDQCNYFCSGGDCMQSTTNASVVCDGCVKEPIIPVCNEGDRFEDFDQCFAYCDGGLCSLNAGEEGIRCGSCP